MSKRTGNNGSGEKLPKVDELANYLVTEAEREITKPDKPTREQISLIMTEAQEKRRARRTAPRGTTKKRRRKGTDKTKKARASSAASKTASRAARGRRRRRPS